MNARTVLALALAGAVAGCGGTRPPPPAQEPTAESQSYFCGMGVLEHAGPKGQVFLPGRSTPLWFGSARDAIAFSRLNPDAGIAAIYVNDMGRANWAHPEAGTWTDARRSWFVIGSRKTSGMGITEAIPFAQADAARRFAAQWGGSVVAFADIPGDYVLGSDGDSARTGATVAGGGS